MSLFPLFAELEGRPVLLVGGGEVAARKATALLAAGAQVRLHALALGDALRALVAAGRVERLAGDFRPGWIDEAWLVVAATDDRAFNRHLAELAQARRRWINVVDDSALCSFHVPAVVDRAPLTLAISSGGTAPMLARRLRERLEAEIAPAWGQLAALLAHRRPRIRRVLPAPDARRRWFEGILDGDVAMHAQAGDIAAAEAALDAALDRIEAGQAPPARGAVLHVACHRTDPDLLTLRDLRALNLADRILADADVPRAVLDLARRDAHRAPMPAPGALEAALAQAVSAGEIVTCVRVAAAAS